MALLLWYNWSRFGQVTEFGHSYLAGGQISRIQQYGLFNWVFLKKNVIAAFLLLPLISLTLPLVKVSWHGMAIQFSSPGLLWACIPSHLMRKTSNGSNDDKSTLSISYSNHTSALIRITTCSSFMILILLLFYQNTGWIQYSWRFILDLLPMLITLIAIKHTFLP